MFLSVTHFLLITIAVISGCMYPSHHWGDWNDSQLLPTIQKLMKGYNRYLRPNFNGKSVIIQLHHNDLLCWTWLNACLSLNEINGLFLVSTCDRGSCWYWNESWYRQHWCHLRNQYGTHLAKKNKWITIHSLMENSEWINIPPTDISGLHGHHLPPSEVEGLQVGVPR